MVICAIALLGAAGAIYVAQGYKATINDQSTQIDALEARLRASQAREQGIIQSISKEVQRREAAERELRQALEANQEWADAPVPAAVVDSLCAQGHCAG